MKIDFERLHRLKSGRRSGKTTEMLVNAAQAADFTSGQGAVFGHTEESAMWLLDEFVKVAESLGFVPHRVGHNVVRVNELDLHFVSAQRRNWSRGRELSVEMYDEVGEEG